MFEFVATDSWLLLGVPPNRTETRGKTGCFRNGFWGLPEKPSQALIKKKTKFTVNFRCYFMLFDTKNGEILEMEAFSIT
jgi:hypothetical protein